MRSLDLDTRIAFYRFDEDETMEEQEIPSSGCAPDNYFVACAKDIASLHNDMFDCLEALNLVLELAYTGKGEPRGYYENLRLIFKRLTRIGNQLDSNLMRARHEKGPGQYIQAVSQFHTATQE